MFVGGLLYASFIARISVILWYIEILVKASVIFYTINDFAIMCIWYCLHNLHLYKNWMTENKPISWLIKEWLGHAVISWILMSCSRAKKFFQPPPPLILLGVDMYMTPTQIGVRALLFFFVCSVEAGRDNSKINKRILLRNITLLSTGIISQILCWNLNDS